MRERGEDPYFWGRQMVMRTSLREKGREREF